MGLIVDASILIADYRQRQDAAPLFETLQEHLFLSPITIAEVLVGLQGSRAHSPAAVAARTRLGRMQLQAYGSREAEEHARLWAGLQRSGISIGHPDLILAATALVHGHGVATLNARHFRLIPGLRVVIPTGR